MSGLQFRDVSSGLFVFKQKTAYEMRISDWSSDVCSSDLTMAAHADLIDQLLRDLLDFAMHHVFPAPNPTTGDRICVAAVGGYGRGELAPWSDVDLLFLLPYKKTPRSEQVVEYVLYMLWDTGLKVGHATRTVDECLRLARDDTTIATSLLESRWIWGEAGLFDELRRRFSSELVQGTGPDFTEAKLAERDHRHRRLGDSRYVLEPNVKDGKGGLRDLHTLYWIAKYLYEVEDVTELVVRGVLTRGELRRFEKAEEFLSTVRRSEEHTSELQSLMRISYA